MQFWELPESAEDVFSLFSPSDIRRTRDTSLANLETLLLAVTSRLLILRHHPSFPSLEKAPERHALNCIRILTRLLPFLYEAENLDTWEDKFFWSARRKRTKKGGQQKSTVLFDTEHPDQEVEEEENEDFEDAKPLAEDLLDALVDMLFYTGFTLPIVERSRTKVTYSIWQTGVGCNTPTSVTKEMENNRMEVLRLLITFSSKSMYMSAGGYSTALLSLTKLMVFSQSARQGRQGDNVFNNMSRQASRTIYAMFHAKHCRLA